MVKRFVAVGIILTIMVSTVIGQNSSREMSVEESYLQDAVELMIIREQSRGESRDMKMIALEYIGDAIERGNKGEEVRAALEYLAFEGIVNKTRENGRLLNNYPDVRTKAAAYLGDLGTPEARSTLIKIISADTEPMVLTEAVKSLAKINNADIEETINIITRMLSKFDTLNPDNLLALSALDAYDKLAQITRGKLDSTTVQLIIHISEGIYAKPVQAKARMVLSNIRKYGQESQNKR
ncbi:MAG: HEAT repeat domain-containing protein [Treponema sp.]|jgi:HEAT repeat protein|nr:HEAT repeat domain-containing protein [Treponema sp.]